MTPPPQSKRVFLIGLVQEFLMRVRALPGISRVGLIGSLTTPKDNPKDADLLVWVDDGLDLAPLAAAGRQLKGRAQGRNAGADIFLVSPGGSYLGRICHYRDCRPGVRLSCRALHCGQRPHLCDDLHDLKLRPNAIQAPPVDLWPQAIVRAAVPDDIQELVGQLAEPSSPPDPRRSPI